MEPERQIEKLLRAFARKRREEVRDSSGLDLHPATRRLLQGEVARHAPTASGERGFFRAWLKARRPQLAFGLCTAAILLVGAVLVFPLFTADESESRLAKASPAVTETHSPAASAENAPAATPATPPPLAIADTELKLADARANKDRDDSFQAANTLSYGLAENERRLSAGAPTEPARTATGAAGQLPAGADIGGRRFTPEVKERGTLAEVDKQKRSTEQLYRSRADSASLKDDSQPTPQIRQQALAERNDTRPEPLFADSVGKQTSNDGFQAARAELKGAEAFAQKTPAAPNDESKANGSGTWGYFATQKFSQLAAGPAAEKSSMAGSKAVLNSFQFEQAGDQIRIVDSDGSTYAGYVQTADDPEHGLPVSVETAAPAVAYREEKLESKKVAPPEKAQAGPAAQKYFFRVTGTNRSLNQPVVFSGDLLAITNGPAISSEALGVGGKLQAAPGRSQLLLRSSRISGKARVGASNEMQINAVPVAR